VFCLDGGRATRSSCESGDRSGSCLGQLLDGKGPQRRIWRMEAFGNRQRRRKTFNRVLQRAEERCNVVMNE
jgi:hypothetical protein